MQRARSLSLPLVVCMGVLLGACDQGILLEPDRIQVPDEPSFYSTPANYYQICRLWETGATTYWVPTIQWWESPCSIDVPWWNRQPVMEYDDPSGVTIEFLGEVTHGYVQLTPHVENKGYCPADDLAIATLYDAQDSVVYETPVEWRGCTDPIYGRMGTFETPVAYKRIHVSPPGEYPAVPTHTGAAFRSFVHYFVPCPVTGDRLLDENETLTDMFSEIWAQSNATASPELRMERGAHLIQNRTTGEFDFQMTDVRPTDTPCNTTAIVSELKAGWTYIAYVHSHPFSHGDLLPLNCNRGPNAFYNAKRFVGLSGEDLDAFKDLYDQSGPPMFPDAHNADYQMMYLLDQDFIYAAPEGTTRENARHMVKRYPRSPGGTCEVRY